MRARVLIVEDDRDIAELVARYLGKAGFATEVLSSGREALTAIRERPPDLVILDLMLPQVDGLEICRIIRAHDTTAAIPIIMLTARGEESDRIVGLEIGADDYMAKPFSPNELVARARALLRRTHRGASSRATTVTYGPIVVDPETHVVSSAGVGVTLTAKEFLLLEYLLAHRGRVLSRDLLLTDVWGYRYTGGTRTVDVHVRRLREKLPSLVEALVTIKQFGYMLVDPAPPAGTAAGANCESLKSEVSSLPRSRHLADFRLEISHFERALFYGANSWGLADVADLRRTTDKSAQETRFPAVDRVRRRSRFSAERCADLTK